MILYYLFTGLSTLACAACAGGIYSHPRDQRRGVAAALALAGFGFWGVCQLLYHLQPDPALALALARATAPGWIFLGPLCLQVFLGASDRSPPLLRRVRIALTVISTLGLVATVATPWVIEGLRPASWGYGVAPGPLFLPFCAVNVFGAGLGVWLSGRRSARFSEEELLRRRWIGATILVPALVMGVTDVALPLRGVVFPPLAPSIFGPLALLALYLRTRVGFSPLTPAHVANEILEILPDGVALLYADDRIRIANNALARLCGCPPDSLEGMPIGLLLRWSGGSESGELRSTSGSPMPVAVSSAQLVDRAEQPVGRVLVIRDLREVADLRNRLVTSGRLAAVGELAAGIAHEINNPLAFVRSNLSQLEERWKRLRPVIDASEAVAGPELRELAADCDELIGESIEGVDRAAEIVRGVKNFAHAGSDVREPTDPRSLVEDALRVASSQLRGRVRVRREYDDDIPLVECAPQQLKQVFLNLVINAAHAVQDGGTVLVAARPLGDEVIVSVADDGCGIPPEIIDRIFDPFFTTKGVGEGTGLGLGIAHQIVTSHGGTIEVESDPGVGTVFRVRLPAAVLD